MARLDVTATETALMREGPDEDGRTALRDLNAIAEAR